MSNEPPSDPDEAVRNFYRLLDGIMAGRRRGAAPHFYWGRPVTLCTDDLPDDDEGPPRWSP